MMNGMGALAWSRLRHDKRQNLLLVLGPAIGLGIAIGLVVLIGMMQASIEQQIVDMVGLADVWLEYPEQRTDFSAEEIRRLRAFAGVERLA